MRRQKSTDKIELMNTVNTLKELLSSNVAKRVPNDDNSENVLYGDVQLKLQLYIDKLKKEYVFIPKIKLESKDIDLSGFQDSERLLDEVISNIQKIMSVEDSSKGDKDNGTI